MKYFILLLIAITTGSSLMAQTTPANETGVLLLGTFHFANRGLGKCEFFEMFNKEVVKYNCFGKLKILEEADQN